MQWINRKDKEPDRTREIIVYGYIEGRNVAGRLVFHYFALHYDYENWITQEGVDVEFQYYFYPEPPNE